MFKIVDDFNGGADNARYDTEEQAEHALSVAIDSFSSVNTDNTICRLTVVPATAEWYFNPHCNSFIWG